MFACSHTVASDSDAGSRAGNPVSLAFITDEARVALFVLEGDAGKVIAC